MKFTFQKKNAFEILHINNIQTFKWRFSHIYRIIFILLKSLTKVFLRDLINFIPIFDLLVYAHEAMCTSKLNLILLTCLNFLFQYLIKYVNGLKI